MAVRDGLVNRSGHLVQESLAIATVPGYPPRWREDVQAGRSPHLAPGWLGWQRLKSFVRPGDKVFLLCNFVQERRLGQSRTAALAKCTHGSVVHAVCEQVLAALGDRGEVLYGNAPLQSSDWGSLMHETGAGLVERCYRRRGKPVRQRDLRLLVAPRSHLGAQKATICRDRRDCVEVELGERSLLHELVGAEDGAQQREGADRAAPKFRVSDYDYRHTEQCQNAINHKYIVSRHVLDADVVIHIPKLKTHEKVGITGALKGVVGIVGAKECLAHYRAGGVREGGDEFPGDGRGRAWQTKVRTSANRSGPRRWTRQAGRMLDRNAVRLLGRCGVTYDGAWHGNDTCWRMALDLARIVHYADRQGRMQAARQRTNICLVDGIVGGEGSGPLSPSAVASNTLLFADDLAICDVAATRLMGFDHRRIPLVQRALEEQMEWPLATRSLDRVNFEIDNETVPLAEIGPVLGRPFQPSAGWARHLLA